jgi:hypothetical protein
MEIMRSLLSPVSSRQRSVRRLAPAVAAAAVLAGGVAATGVQPALAGGGTAPLIGIVTTSEHALVKDGSLTAGWNDEHSNVHDISVASDPTNGPLIGIVEGKDFTALVKEGNLSASWNDELTDVYQIAVASDPTNGPLIGVDTMSGEVMVKEGSLSAPWTDTLSDAGEVAVASDPTNGPIIAAVTSSGDLMVQHGSLTAGWSNDTLPVDSGTPTQVAVATDPTHGWVIAIATTTGEIWEQNEASGGKWFEEFGSDEDLRDVVAAASDPANGQLIGGLVGSQAEAQEGGPGEAWNDEHSGVSELSVASDASYGPMIGIVTTSGEAMVKEGTLTAGWNDEHDNAIEISVAG